MKTVAFMPIKLNNERLPGKNIKPFSDGTPVLQLAQKTVLSLMGRCVIDEFFVFCSDKKVMDYCLPGTAYLGRADSLDARETIGTDIYAAFLDAVIADVYILIHATSPFVSGEHISQCIEAVLHGGYDSAFCAKKLQNFLWQDNRPLNFNLSKPPRTQDMNPIYMELSTPYVFTRDCFVKNNARTGVNPYICECTEIEAIDIDYPEDFALADLVYMNMIKAGN